MNQLERNNAEVGGFSGVEDRKEGSGKYLQQPADTSVTQTTTNYEPKIYLYTFNGITKIST